MTEGLRPLATVSAIFSAAHAGSPTAAAATLQTLMKSRRETPARPASKSVPIAISILRRPGLRGAYAGRSKLQPSRIAGLFGPERAQGLRRRLVKFGGAPLVWQALGRCP